GVPEGLMSSFPCICKDGKYEIVQGLEIDEFSRGRIDASVGELIEERDAVRELGLI
ncbi:MAG: malate dehydrogenase, partial [Actinobacteria bacterium]|nr:malate dehydrogenase [Actinomycetota bacterium]